MRELNVAADIFQNFSCQPTSEVCSKNVSPGENTAGTSLVNSQQASGHVDDCKLKNWKNLIF